MIKNLPEHFYALIRKTNESSPSMTRQEEWVYENRHRQFLIGLGRIGLLIGFLLLWEWSVEAGILNDFIFSSPTRVLHTFMVMTGDGTIFRHLGWTMAETIISFLMVTILSLLAALLLWKWQMAAKILEPALIALNSLPKSALAPLLIVWMGNNTKTIIVSAVSIAIFGSMLSLYSEFTSTDPEKILLIRSLGGTSGDIMTKVLLPCALPNIASHMKVNIGLCLIGVIIGEMLVCRFGLGYLIIYGSQVFRLDYILLSMVLLCAMAMILYRGVTEFEKILLRF